MKKVAIILSIIYLMLVVPVCAADAAQIDVDIPAPAGDGQDYAVTVTVTQNPGFLSFQMELFYDSEAAKCIKVVPGEVLKEMLTDTNPKAEGERTSAIISAAGMEETKKTGVAATFFFELTDQNPDFEFTLVEIRSEGGAKPEYELNISNAFADEEKETEDEEKENTKNPSRPSNTSPGSLVKPDTDEPPAEKQQEFTDIDGHWAKEYIQAAADMNIVGGYEDGSFLPDKAMTRAEFATILWNMAEKPVPVAQLPFADVTGADWFYFPVCWAYEQGYIKGVTQAEFLPHEIITREQAMTILYRYSGSPHAEQILDGFEDKEQVSDYAVDALCWATQNKIIQGTDPVHISPGSSATRAQLATVVVRMR